MNRIKISLNFEGQKKRSFFDMLHRSKSSKAHFKSKESAREMN